MKFYFAQVDIEESIEYCQCGFTFDTDIIIFKDYEELLDFTSRYSFNGGTGCCKTLAELVEMINNSQEKFYTYEQWQKTYSNRKRADNKTAIKMLKELIENSIVDTLYEESQSNDLITKMIY